MTATRHPGQRAGLTRAAVLATAQRVLAERGLDGLTMRYLANQLGVAPNALYSYVSNKTELIDELLDDVLAAVQVPEPGTSEPHDGLSVVMTSAFDVLVKHPDLVPLYLARQGARGQHAKRLGEVMFDLLGQAGIMGGAAHEARRVLIVYTIGFAALATPAPADNGVATPLTVEEISGNFASGLRWLLTGILSGESTHARGD